MRTRRTIFLVLLAAVLMVLLWLILDTRQQAQVRAEYYATILTQAPCVAGVCPGFQGRDRAIEQLSNSDVVEGKERGQALIGLLFTNSDEEIVGSGVIYFTNDAQGIPIIVRQISFGLDDLKLESVFNTFGEPDQFLFISGCGMGWRVQAMLFYLSQGIEVSIGYTTRQPDSQALTGETPVKAIQYFQPGDFEAQIRDSLERSVTETVAFDIHPSVTEEDFIEQIRPWPGMDASPTPTADFCPR